MVPNGSDVSDILTHAWSSRITYTLEEFKNELKLEMLKRDELDDNPDVSKCVLALGEAGIGKTQSIRQALAEINGEYLMYHHGATMEEDNAGTPFQEKVNDQMVTKIAIPDHLACFYREPLNGCGALVVEEIFTGSTTGHQNQARQFIDRRFGLKRMFKSWRVIATSNPETADYGTVKSADKALAKRMIIFPIKPTSEEKLTYWAGKMDPVLYNFHVLNHLNNLSYIEATDSRSWMNIGDSISRRRATNGTWLTSSVSLGKLVSCHAGVSVGAAFKDFVDKGNDPDHYPIPHMQILTADNKAHAILIARIRSWVVGRRTALLGATNWSLNIFLRNHTPADLKDFHENQVACNLAEYMRVIGEGGYSDMAADTFDRMRQSDLARSVMKKLVGTPVEAKILALWDSLRPGVNIQRTGMSGGTIKVL